jgi:hypothetical protein
MAENKDIMEKLLKLNDDLTEFIHLSKDQFMSINGQVEEIRKQTTETNGRVNRLDERMEAVEEFNERCPANGLKDALDNFQSQMTIWIFFSKHWKSVAAFLGIMAAGYAAVVGAIEAAKAII